MMEDEIGQVALEYILIFAISLILLIVFTLPLAENSIENTLDVSDAMEAKSNMAKISQAVMQVYGEGQGSRHTVNVISKKPIEVIIDEKQISSNIMLNDGTNKLIKMNCRSNLAKSSIHLSKGENTVVAEWQVGSEKMEIYTKLF